MCPWGWIKFSIDSLWNLQIQLTFQMKIYQVPCGHNSSHSLPPLFWNFSDVFCMEWRHACGLDIILWLFFLTFLLCELCLFWYEMLSKRADNGYLVGATPLTVFHQLFWNIADVFSMEWRCACGFGIILWLFFSLFLLCKVSLFLVWNVIKVYTL